ncbi:hypothetical protein EYR40_002001 [Pleurotus pulmonarius]|nr:hypothetical protein EYR40_002001 [Pleurotus pulmonarius]
MPQLTHLEILLRDQSVILFSSLLSSLRRSPTLEEIQISGMVKNDLADSPSRIKLPRLTCLSITSVDLEAAAIFAYLEYPANTRVAFRSTRLPAEELDLTNVIAICDRFLEPGAPALHGIKISDSRSDGPFQLSASYRGHSHSGEDADEDADEDDDYIDFSISLTIHYCDSAAACEALCSALPLETVHTLKVGGFDGMAQEQWKTIFRRCKCVKHAQFNSVLVSLFQSLVQTEGPLLLPKLEGIELILCTFIKPENRHTKPETSPSLRIFEGFLEQRKKLKKPVDVSLMLCLITPEAVESLEKSTIDVTKLRRAIDEEIAERTALHEASIRDLKSRRNAYSNTSILPPEILSRIFLAAKDAIQVYGAPKEAGWLNVAAVCQEWRSIALASPRMWSSIDITKMDCALEFLKRSKSAPLRINCKKSPLAITAANEEMVQSIMAEVGRIQELDINATTQGEVIRLLSSNAPESAPLLQHLRLVVPLQLVSPDPFPINDMYPKMTFLRHLELERINIFELPPLPHLTHLTISLGSWSSMRPSSLLSSLSHSPKLEEIDITGLVKDNPTDSPTRVTLPSLTRIAISSFDLKASTIFTYLDHPPSASVAFTNLMTSIGEPDLSSLVKLCRRFLEQGAPAIHKIHFSSTHRFDDSFRFNVSCWGPPISDKLSITLNMESRYYCAACIALCSVLPIESVPNLGVNGFHDMTHAQWNTIFQRCKEVQKLLFNNVPLSLFRTLIKSSKSKSMSPQRVPKLQTIKLAHCTLIDRENLYAPLKDSLSFVTFAKFLRKRKRLNMPVEKVIIEMCEITDHAVLHLEQYADVAWDGEEIDSDDDDDDEEEEESYHDSDDSYGYPGFY